MAEAEIQFFTTECATRDKELSQSVIREFQRRHTIQKAASQFLLQNGENIPEALRQKLPHQEFAAMEAALFEAQALRNELRQKKQGEVLQNEVSHYSEDSETEKIRSRFELPLDPLEQRWQRCYEMLGQLSAYLTGAQLENCQQKIQAIESLNASLQALHLDSWNLELFQTLREQRKRIELLKEIELVLDELNNSGYSESLEWKPQLEELIQKEADTISLESALQEVKKY